MGGNERQPIIGCLFISKLGLDQNAEPAENAEEQLFLPPRSPRALR